jgi:hypothetical protein
MKLLKCKLCLGEVDLVGNERSVERKVKCQKCGFTNANVEKAAGPEVIIMNRRPKREDLT